MNTFITMELTIDGSQELLITNLYLMNIDYVVLYE
jgi:hypothetical protein